MNNGTVLFRAMIAIVAILAAAPVGQAQQPLLQITSPTSGTLETEGATVNITISADPSVQNIFVLDDKPLPDVQATSPTQFTLTVPTTTPPGWYNLTAVGSTASGEVISAPVAIDIEPASIPPLTTNPLVLTLNLVGDQFPMRVVGTFANGTTLDVTHSTLLSYASNNTQIVTVSSTGMVTAVGAGQTYITVSANGYVYTAMVVTVLPQPSTAPPPNIATVTPTSGIPGTTVVTITGSNFGASQGSGYVQIGTQNGVVGSWSNGQIVATVSSLAASGVVCVNQNGLYSNTVPFTITTPVIQGISPLALAYGGQVTLRGSGFGASQGSGYLKLQNALVTNIQSWNDGQIVAVVPTGTTGGSAKVTQNGHTSNAVVFTMAAPVLTSMTPTSVLPGTPVMFVGSGFGSQSSGSVTFNNQPAASIQAWQDTQVTATVAAGTMGGLAYVSQNGVRSNGLTFSMTPPTLSNITPTSVLPGTRVTLNGSGFGANQGSGYVTFNNMTASSIYSWNDTTVIAFVASGTFGGSAYVTQNGARSNGVSFSMTPPTLTNISPTNPAVGDTVVFTGSNFGAAQGSGYVTFNNKTATTILGWSDGSVSAVLPSGTTSGLAYITQNGARSNGVSFTVH